ncbi:MAG: VCBS repeat-containing protein, partial [Planctomycetales bacterium]|nr:VCBS repeat-containing protein [Planctomycetales bacterium]
MSRLLRRLSGQRHTNSVRRCTSWEWLEHRHLLTQLVDIDNDGDLDGYGAVAIKDNAWFENVDGEGTFVSHSLDSRRAPTIAADLDGDGDVDLVTTEPAWFENDGQGQFTGHPISASAGTRIVATDVGRDGRLDLLLFGNNLVSLLRNSDGVGNFTLEVTLAADGLLDAADIDGDNDIDLLAKTAEGEFSVLWNQDDVVTPELVAKDLSETSEIGESHSVDYSDPQLVDIDLDGQFELTIETTEWWHFVDTRFSNFVGWRRLGVPDTRLRLIQGGCYYFADGARGDFWLLDADHDGDVDGVCQGDYGEEIVWSENAPSGGFRQHAQIYLGLPLDTVVTDGGDIDGDGVVDWVTNRVENSGPVWFDGASGKIHQPDLPPLYDAVPVTFGSNQLHLDVELFDVDGDTTLEAATLSSRGLEIWDIAEVPTALTLSQTLELDGAVRMDTGDLDDDGDADLIVIGSDKLWAATNDGSGRFVVTGEWSHLGAARDVVLADFDADDDLDVALALGDNVPNQVWLNDGTGQFQATAQKLGVTSSNCVAVQDIDNDGDLDIVFGNEEGHDEFWSNDGSGTFVLRATGREDGAARAVTYVDLWNAGKASRVRVGANLGDEIVAGDRVIGGLSAGTAVAVGDVNGDGQFDIVTAADQHESNRIWLAPVTRTADRFGNDSSHALALGDVDQDGDLDVIFANEGLNTLFLNGTNPAT